MKRVHCLGVMVVDALSRPLPEYPVPGKITQVVTESLRFLPGGGAANTGSALGQLGVPVGVFSKVGGDPNGTLILDELRKHGVDTAGVRVSAEDSTPFTYVGIHPDGERTFIHTPGANCSFSRKDVDLEALLATDFLLYQDLWVLPLLDGRAGAEILAEAQRRGIVTLLDECWGLGPDRDTWETMLPHVDYALPSLHDMRAIYEYCSRDEILDQIHAKGVRTIALKMGEDGCLVSADGQRTLVPSVATDIVDTTGAGDCFDAGFVAGLAHGLLPVDAARAGSVVAAACIRHVGGAVGIPRFEQVLRELG